MNRNPEVDAWFASYDNPMKAAVERVRELILACDSRVTECIKWKSPTFEFKGPIASFNPRSKQHASLMFHRGADIPGDHPVLEGGGDTARYIRFASLDDVDAKRLGLEAAVGAWCDWKASQ